MSVRACARACVRRVQFRRADLHTNTADHKACLRKREREGHKGKCFIEQELPEEKGKTKREKNTTERVTSVDASDGRVGLCEGAEQLLSKISGVIRTGREGHKNAKVARNGETSSKARKAERRTITSIDASDGRVCLCEGAEELLQILGSDANPRVVHSEPDGRLDNLSCECNCAVYPSQNLRDGCEWVCMPAPGWEDPTESYKNQEAVLCGANSRVAHSEPDCPLDNVAFECPVYPQVNMRVMPATASMPAAGWENPTKSYRNQEAVLYTC